MKYENETLPYNATRKRDATNGKQKKRKGKKMFRCEYCGLAEWYEAETFFQAAAKFILDHPEIESSSQDESPLILVVEKDTYRMGSYPADLCRIEADYLVGLRSHA